MAQNQRTLFGQVALDLGYLTEQSLEKLVIVQRRAGGEAPLAMLAVRSGMLTQDQVTEILETQQQRRWELAESSGGAGHESLGKIAVELGMAGQQSIDAALAEFERRRALGENVRLGEICVQLGTLTPEQVHELLEHQRKNILVCISCGAQYNVQNLAPGQKMRCPECSSLLQGIEEVESVAVAPVEMTAGPPLRPTGVVSGMQGGMLRRHDGTSIHGVFDSSTRLFGGHADLNDLRQKISSVRARFRSRPAGAATATIQKPAGGVSRAPQVRTPAKGQLSGPGGLGKFALHGTSKGPSEYDQFLVALEQEAAATETSGMVFTAALSRALDSYPEIVTPTRETDGFHSRDTGEIYIGGLAEEEIVDMQPAPGAEQDLGTFFTEPEADVVDLIPRSQAEAHRVAQMDTHETSELLEHELPSSDIYDRAVLIAAEKIPATPPGGIASYQRKAAPSSPQKLEQLRKTPAPPGREPAWRVPPKKPNWLLDHWLKIICVLLGAGIVGLVGWIVYFLMFSAE